MPKDKSSNRASGLGPKYGRTVRRRWNEQTAKKRKKYRCPDCHTLNVKHVSVGIWSCDKCGYTFAGGAYEPRVIT